MNIGGVLVVFAILGVLFHSVVYLYGNPVLEFLKSISIISIIAAIIVLVLGINLL